MQTPEIPSLDHRDSQDKLEDLTQKADAALGYDPAGSEEAKQHAAKHWTDFSAALHGMLAVALDLRLTREQREQAQRELEQWLMWGRERL